MIRFRPCTATMKAALLLTLIFIAASVPIPLPAQDPAAETTLPAATPAAAEGSVYDLESKWRDQSNREVVLSDLGDKVRVVVMGYTTCQNACPRLIADLVSIENELAKDKETAAEVSYAFISIDPETDTPAQLAKVAAQYGFDPERWKFLTGNEDGVLELAVALGMKYRKTTPMDFAHSNIITVLRRDGSIAHQQEGLAADKTETLKAIRTATEDL